MAIDGGSPSGPVDEIGVLSYSYLYGKNSLQKAYLRFGGPKNLLGSASQAIGESTDYDVGESSPKSSDHEIRELARFAQDAGLMMDSNMVFAYMKENAMRGGSEHKVAEVIKAGRVLKDLNTGAIATESLFDYLTDHELSNFFFGDDVQIEGFYENDGNLHIVTSQPWIDGPHPSLPVLKNRLEEQGIECESPTGSTGSFIIHDENAGPINLIDIKPDNVVLDVVSGIVQPIDFHFYFDSHAERQQAIDKLGVRNPDTGGEKYYYGQYGY